MQHGSVIMGACSALQSYAAAAAVARGALPDQLDAGRGKSIDELHQ
jgi:hypothetical protein